LYSSLNTVIVIKAKIRQAQHAECMGDKNCHRKICLKIFMGDTYKREYYIHLFFRYLMMIFQLQKL